jgi:hypothetical protein
VTERDLPEDVRRFIAGCIDTAEELDLLLLLHRTPERAWDAESAAQAVYSVPASTGDRLATLAGKGLLAAEPGPPPSFRYTPRTPELAAQVSALAAVYRLHRVAIVNLIYATREDPLRSFADAFRLKKKEP